MKGSSALLVASLLVAACRAPPAVPARGGAAGLRVFPPAPAVSAARTLPSVAASLSTSATPPAPSAPSRISIEAVISSDPSLFEEGSPLEVPPDWQGLDGLCNENGFYERSRNSVRHWRPQRASSELAFSVLGSLGTANRLQAGGPLIAWSATGYLSHPAGSGTSDLFGWLPGSRPRLLFKSSRAHSVEFWDSRFAVSADGRFLAVLVWDNTCMCDGSRRWWTGLGRTEASPCGRDKRLLLVAVDTGQIRFATPGSFDPSWTFYFDGTSLFAFGVGGLRDQPCGPWGMADSPEEPPADADAPGFWVGIDTQRLTLERTVPPPITSPDGQYKLSSHGHRLTVNGPNQPFEIEGLEPWLSSGLLRPVTWLGPHSLQLNYGPQQSVAIAFDLETRRARPLVPAGYDGIVLSPDLSFGVLFDKRARRWATRRP